MPDQPNAFSNADAEALALYQQLRAAMEGIGPMREVVKRGSVEWHRERAFATIHFRKHSLGLSVIGADEVDSPRMLHHGETADGRRHSDTRVTIDGDIDAEMLGWLRAAYAES